MAQGKCDLTILIGSGHGGMPVAGAKVRVQ